MQLCNMAEIEKEEVEFPACATLWQGEFIEGGSTLFSFILCTWLSCIKKIGQSWVCWAVGPIAIPCIEQIVAKANATLCALTETWIKEDDDITPLQLCSSG